jgi:hypothetical protein
MYPPLAPKMAAWSIVIILLLSLAVAQHAPVGEPSGNVFLRPLDEVFCHASPDNATLADSPQLPRTFLPVGRLP